MQRGRPKLLHVGRGGTGWGEEEDATSPAGVREGETGKTGPCSPATVSQGG
ncbi:MAG: hypothetical protein N2652_09410 [Kiritimatiellae bacterium]|nr:hypothetical protein [Kiritimatiellia bacterium]